MSISPAARKPSVVIEPFPGRIYSPGVDPPPEKIIPVNPAPSPEPLDQEKPPPTLEEMLANMEKA